MKRLLHKIYRYYMAQKSLRLIVLAAIMLQIILAIQHFYAHHLVERDLERDAEIELTMKAILIKGILNTNEKAVNSLSWTVKQNLRQPDSVFNAGKWLVYSNEYLEGAGIAFIPYYYPSKGQLYELYVQNDSNLTVRQIANARHDYTKMSFFNQVIDQDQPRWSDPYIDTVANNKLISTYSIPIHDKGNPVAVLAIDMSLNWMDDTINARHIYPTSFNMLLTEDGKPAVLADDHAKAYDVEQIIRLINDSTTSRTKSATGRTTIIDFKSEVDGAKGRVHYAFMKGKPHWQLALVNYDKEVYSELNWMTFNIFMLMLLTLATLAFIVHHYAQSEKRLQKAHLEQERIGSELRIASAIQQEMLPTTNSDPLNEDIDVSGLLQPAKEVGGDLYDFFIRDEKLYFCIGDVSGKGVPSALFMAVTQALFHAVTARVSQPAHILQAINGSICHHNTRNMFITFFIGVLDLPTGRLRYCNAGHNAPVLVGDSPQPLPVHANLPLGVMKDYKFEAQECQLSPGEALFLYTDGLNEAMNPQHQQFGMLRVIDCLTQSQEQKDNCQQMLQRVENQVRKFVDKAEQSDDLTLLAICYTPVVLEDALNERITLQNDVRQVPRLNAFVEQVTLHLQLDTKPAQEIKLAVEEAVVNVMEYAYPAGQTGDILVEAMANEQWLKVVITDQGLPFDPTESAKADTTLSVEERPIGGLGIFLVRQMMDSINYERIDGKNILTLRKNITKT